MQAVVLAAGRSTRTYPLTNTRPKPLIPLWGRPLLEHQLRQLRELVEEAILVVGYRKEQIENHFGREYEGLKLRYVHQRNQRGTADALLAARDHLEGRALILNGDDFYHRQDLAALVRAKRGLVVTRAPDPQNRAVVTLDGETVVDIVEKPKSPPPGAWCSVGGYCVEVEDLALLDELTPSPRGELELPDFVLRLVRSKAVRAQKMRRLWFPLTYAWDVLKVTIGLWEEASWAPDLEVVAEGHEALRKRRDVTWGESVRLHGPIWLGSGVRIGDGCRLVGPAAIGPGTALETGVSLERTILFGDARLARGSSVSDSVLGQGVEVRDDARLESCPGSELAIAVKGQSVIPEIGLLGAIAGDGAVIERGARVPAGTLIAPADTF